MANTQRWKIILGLKLKQGYAPHNLSLGHVAKPKRAAEPVSPDTIFFDEDGKRVPELKLAGSDARSFAASVAAWTLFHDNENHLRNVR